MDFYVDIKSLKVIDYKPACPYCDDKGLEVRDVDGRKVAHPCRCLLKKIEDERYESLVRMSKVGRLRHMTFENYKPQCKGQEKALQKVAARHDSYYLFGHIGTGKTHLMTATVHRANQNGVQALQISVPRLLDEIRRRGKDDAVIDEDLAKSIPYLALDDLGKERTTDWVTERLWLLIDERYLRYKAGEAHTSITANVSMKDLDKMIDRSIADRIRGMCVEVFVPGESYRRRD